MIRAIFQFDLKWRRLDHHTDLILSSLFLVGKLHRQIPQAHKLNHDLADWGEGHILFDDVGVVVGGDFELDDSDSEAVFDL